MENVAPIERKREPNAPEGLTLFQNTQDPLVLSVGVHDDFESVKDDWKTFEKTAVCTPFQSFSWLSTWYETIGKHNEEEPVIVTLRDAHGQLMMLFPLSRILTPVGDMVVDMGSPICDYHVPLFAPRFIDRIDAEGIHRVWSFILDNLPKADIVSLAKQPEFMGKTRNPMAWVCTKDYYTPNAYQMSLRGYEDWNDLITTKRSGKARSRINGKRNKLAKLGELEFRAVTEPRERVELAKKLLTMKTADLNRTGKNSIFKDAQVRNFVTSVCAQEDDSDSVLIHVLTCAGKEVAITLSLNWQHTIYYFIASYERGPYEKSSPGALTLCSIFEWCLNNDVTTFDFTIGDEAYKLEWSDRSTRLFCGTFAVTVKGRIGERLEAAKLSLKHTIKSSPMMYKVASSLLFHIRR